jgi:allophanate hydrolase subunit 2
MSPARPSPPESSLDLPICFAKEFGTDLADVARAAHVEAAAIPALLADCTLTVEQVGFLPGFPYIAGLPETLHLPRRATPRPRVPAGSVALANGRLGVYPVDSPGGWHLIGRTPLRLFDPWREPPSYFTAGARVRVRAVTREEFDRLADEERVRARAGQCAAADITEHRDVFEVIVAGPSTTIEDHGRMGWAHVGVAPGGVSDPAAMRLANALVGNPSDAAVLEFALQGPTLVPTRDVTVALVGGTCAATVDGAPLRGNRAVRVRAGARITCGAVLRGLRAWLAVDGGIAVPPVLGSRGTHRLGGFGGLDGRALRKGDLVPVGAPAARAASPRRFLGPHFVLAPSDGVRTLRYRPAFAQVEPSVACAHVTPSAAAAHVTPSAVAAHVAPSVACAHVAPSAAAARASFAPAGRPTHLLAESALHAAMPDRMWRVHPDSDRMGLRLDGPPLPRPADAPDPARTPSVPVSFGTIQLPPDGRPIILGADHQTTGGYPVIGALLEADRSAFAQCRPGDTLRLMPVSSAAADAADAAHRRDVAMACAALRL